MGEENKKDKSNNDEFNIYKFTTYILLCVVALTLFYFGFDYYGDQRYSNGVEKGQSDVMNHILENVAEDGTVSFKLKDNRTLTLVPYEVLDINRKTTIMEIMDLVEKDGFVRLYKNETEMVLVPYETLQQVQNQQFQN